MIRLIQRRLIIPRGDTGSFTIPVIKPSSENVAVFTIFDDLTHTRLFQKKLTSEGDVLNIAFTHNETVNLKPGKYLWDIKYYSNPLFVEDELVGGDEVDSYYAGYSLPVCEIRPTGDDYLISDDAPSGTLAPDQLDIITNAITALNEAVEKTQTNVEHYPVIRDETWYVWDAESNDYVNTGVSANGIVGNGIASAVLNDDYSLTLNFTDGTSFTTSSIRGETGNGIDDIVLNSDFTLTIIYTDGERYTTPSIRGPVGPTPQFSIGTVQEGSSAAASITGTAENPVLNLTLPNANVPTRVSELENDAGFITVDEVPEVPVQDVQINGTSIINNNVAEIPIAQYSSGQATLGLVKSYGLGINIDSNGEISIKKASDGQMKRGSGDTAPIVAAQQHASTFYGLAKAAGDTTQSQSSNAVGTYTNEAKAAIQTMLDVPSNADVAAKQDTLTFDNAPTANSTNPVTSGGVYSAIANINTMKIHICAQGEYNAETGVPTVQNPDTQTFYLVPGGEGSNLFIEWAYVNDGWERFGSADVEVPVQDVQVNGVSVLSDGVANVPVMSSSTFGVAKTNGIDLTVDRSNQLLINAASIIEIKTATGTSWRKAMTVGNKSAAIFYGLAQAAGADMKDIANTTVGIYPDAQKEAIQSMFGISQMLAPTNPNLVASQAYSIGDVFVANGHLYKATAAIAQDEAIIPDTNCVETTMVDAGGKIKDVQVAGSSVVENDGIASVPLATNNSVGVVKAGTGISINLSGQLYNTTPTDNAIKLGAAPYNAVTLSKQHVSIFYGLSKVAGVDLKDETVTLGTYPETSKTAIKAMLGVQDGLKVVRLI